MQKKTAELVHKSSRVGHGRQSGRETCRTKARQEGNTVGRQRSTHIKYKAYEIKEVRMVEKDGGVSCKGVYRNE